MHLEIYSAMSFFIPDQKYFFLTVEIVLGEQNMELDGFHYRISNDMEEEWFHHGCGEQIDKGITFYTG